MARGFTIRGHFVLDKRTGQVVTTPSSAPAAGAERSKRRRRRPLHLDGDAQLGVTFILGN
jgi:hypothetical protein